jgi:ABC-2 type transport system permease protein
MKVPGLAALRRAGVRVSALLRKEFLQLLRDRRMRFVLVGPPLIQLVLFGYAATFDVRHADIAVIDRDTSQASRELLAAIVASGHYTLRMARDLPEASAQMDRSQARVILQVPPDYARTRRLQLIADGSDPNSAQLIAAELVRIVAQAAAVSSGAAPSITVEERAWFNPNLEDRWYFVPGIMANVIFLSTLMLSAMVVVREREFGTLERLLVTPVARAEFLVCKMVPVAVVGVVDALLIAAVAVGWFGVPFAGHVVDLVAATLLLLVSTLGLGLLVSSHARTQQQAMLSASFFIMPMMVLSGFAFPIRNMPMLLRQLSLLDPLRYYLVVVRDIFLAGAGVAQHPVECASMAGLGLAALLAAATRLR